MTNVERVLDVALTTRSLQPILATNYSFLRQKICLMALIEAVFKRTANNRSMSFQTIAEEVRLPRDEVEHLVMKALRFVAPCIGTSVPLTVISIKS